ncbi:hypothetical protein H8356DRAFT_357572 [Neocallimastix lanati (nom. inval.)]|uniref:Uncharacterized protein n=1 Tax=Neocallimastix californiae TaxID=1754190 RepID=A0A1Y2D6W5_9FUNG|nr:hypothetical protein H8356DRAFT_357572 [Neocallimastix sp. JGI-2020a]ORY55028.1 hypothetical protein LY90DRAFT_507263 [Neocallimastix californiae]|eukprot:ORY55028.1 hypothetical protein LY90DRAFT_507263 [Neocallimastix californiae]
MSNKHNKTKNDELVEKYKKYAETPEAFAVLFVKKYLNSSKGKWVDILDTNIPEYYVMEDLEFQSVECELFKRTIQPVYPEKELNMSEEDYYYKCRAITWEAAHTDIDQQRRKNIKGLKFQIVAKKVSGNKKIFTLDKNNFKEIKDSINKLSKKWEHILLQGINSDNEKSKTIKYSFNAKNFQTNIENKLDKLNKKWKEISIKPCKIEIITIKRINE